MCVCVCVCASYTYIYYTYKSHDTKHMCRLRTVLGAHKAALNVQRVTRGHWARRLLADRGARGAAALTLQRVYRGYAISLRPHTLVA